jgi:hypothetical protein
VSVGVDDAPGLDRVLDEGEQAVGARVGDAGEPDPAMPRPRFSTAIATAVFFSAPRPGLPRATPPTKLSSTSTSPESLSRSGRTIARRSLCSIAHAVS